MTGRESLEYIKEYIGEYAYVGDIKILEHELDLLDAAIFYIARTTMKDKTWNEIREALERGVVKDDK